MQREVDFGGFWFSISWKAQYKNLRAFKSIIAQKLLLYRKEICCQTKFKCLLDKCALDTHIHIKSIPVLKWSYSIGAKTLEKSFVWINTIYWIWLYICLNFPFIMLIVLEEVWYQMKNFNMHVTWREECHFNTTHPLLDDKSYCSFFQEKYLNLTASCPRCLAFIINILPVHTSMHFIYYCCQSTLLWNTCICTYTSI